MTFPLGYNTQARRQHWKYLFILINRLVDSVSRHFSFLLFFLFPSSTCKPHKPHKCIIIWLWNRSSTSSNQNHFKRSNIESLFCYCFIRCINVNFICHMCCGITQEVQCPTPTWKASVNIIVHLSISESKFRDRWNNVWVYGANLLLDSGKSNMNEYHWMAFVQTWRLVPIVWKTLCGMVSYYLLISTTLHMYTWFNRPLSQLPLTKLIFVKRVFLGFNRWELRTNKFEKKFEKKGIEHESSSLERKLTALQPARQGQLVGSNEGLGKFLPILWNMITKNKQWGYTMIGYGKSSSPLTFLGTTVTSIISPRIGRVESPSMFRRRGHGHALFSTVFLDNAGFVAIPIIQDNSKLIVLQPCQRKRWRRCQRRWGSLFESRSYCYRNTAIVADRTLSSRMTNNEDSIPAVHVFFLRHCVELVPVDPPASWSTHSIRYLQPTCSSNLSPTSTLGIGSQKNLAWSQRI